MYKQQAKKMRKLLHGSHAYVEQAFILLDSLVDTLPDEGRDAFKKSIFRGLSFKKRTFTWIEHRIGLLEKTHDHNMNVWDERRKNNEYFWGFLELYFRMCPEELDNLPSVVDLTGITKTPTFLKKNNSCKLLIVDDANQVGTIIEECSTVTSIILSANDYSWRNSPFVFDLNKVRGRTTDLLFVASGIEVQWKMHGGVCELVKFVATHKQRARLQAFSNQINLGRYPLLGISPVYSDDVENSLWRHKTPSTKLEIGALRLLLSDDKDACIGDRVQQVLIMQARIQKSVDNCIIESIFGSRVFPVLKEVIVLNEGRLNLRFTEQMLKCLPSVTHLSIQGGHMDVFWSEGVWSCEHPLMMVTADANKRFCHHWEFSATPGSLRERVVNMSVELAWLAGNVDLLVKISHLNLFNPTGEWSFVNQLSNVQRMQVNGRLCDGGFNYHAVSALPCFITEPLTILNLSKSSNLLEFLCQFSDKQGDVSLQLIQTLKNMRQTQNVPEYFQTWLEYIGIIRIGNSYAWMDRGTFHYKAYSTVGIDYKKSAHLYSILNVERLVAGVSNVRLQRMFVRHTAVRYNNNRLPLENLEDDGIESLLIEAECDLTDLRLLSSLEVLSITDQSTWLRSIPEEIGCLINLRELYLWGNDLHELPEAIGKLSRLQTINISGNHFTNVPKILFTLPNLQTVCLRGCSDEEGIRALQKRGVHFVDVDSFCLDG